MAGLTDFERERARVWLERMRGDLSQLALAEDITARTGWSITRDRYSKYESGALPFGRSVLAHFEAYWASRGEPGPDLTPPPPVLSLEERAVLAAERQADATAALVAELLKWRTEDRVRIDQLEATVKQVVAGALAHAGRPAQAAHGAPQGSAG